MIVRRTLLVAGALLLLAACGESSSGSSTNSSVATGAPPTLATLPPATTTSTTVPMSTPGDCRYVDKVPVPPPADLAIQIGDCGPGVQQVQQLLSYLGYAIGVDGDFGPATQGVVQQYETSKGLTADGIVDAQTFSQLDYEATP
ncbi:MAG TPA: peptidoglycan-binding domain-containing protein [Ilumatobacteraceae bacterium]|nr:peptidoglycan-binding domain-containing protein [Ilumatobacteraceae bacterium]